jgi:hypothetical protein
MNQFIKIAATGEPLPAEAADAHVVVRDAAHNLEWLVAYTTKKPVNHKKAEAAVAKLKTLGHTDWRLPTRVELLTLVDDTKFRPAIDTNFFPGTESDWHWTATPAAWSPSDCAWLVGFSYGGASANHRSSAACVRAVRSVVPASGQ